MQLHWLRFGKREKVRFLAGLWLAGSFVFGMNVQGLPAAPQEESSEAVPRVALSELSGTPGASLMMPLYFIPDPNNSLRSVELDIDFVSNNLKFQKASPGLAAEQANAEILASVTDGPPDEDGRTHSTLHIKAAVPSQATGKGLPDGLLAYLLFQISLDAKPFRIRLVPNVTLAVPMGNPQGQVADVATEEGLVIVEVLDVMPEATCFFFSH